MQRIVCAVNESLYYQLLCKGLLLSIMKHMPGSYSPTILLDGRNQKPFADISKHIEIFPVEPLNITCGSVESRTTYARLEIPYIFPRCKRILYLDVDTYLLNEIHDLFTVPFDTVAAVVPGKELNIEDFLKAVFQVKLKILKYKINNEIFTCGDINHKYFNAG